MSTTTQDARLSGPEIRQQVFGAPKGRPAGAPGGADPFLAPFFETAIEHVWGGVNEELKTHLRGAVNLGWTVDELREALLQTAPYAGFSAANEALQALSAVATQG